MYEQALKNIWLKLKSLMLFGRTATNYQIICCYILSFSSVYYYILLIYSKNVRK